MEETEMSFTITCPICGKRNLYEFRFGGEEAPGEASGQSVPPGVRRQWWCHRDGCGTWFTVWRDLLSNCEVKDPGKRS